MVQKINKSTKQQFHSKINKQSKMISENDLTAVHELKKIGAKREFERQCREAVKSQITDVFLTSLLIDVVTDANLSRIVLDCNSDQPEIHIFVLDPKFAPTYSKDREDALNSLLTEKYRAFQFVVNPTKLGYSSMKRFYVDPAKCPPQCFESKNKTNYMVEIYFV